MANNPHESLSINGLIRGAWASHTNTQNPFKIGILNDENVSIFSVRLSIHAAFPEAHIANIDAHMPTDSFHKALGNLDILVLPGVAKETCLYHKPLMAAKDVLADAVTNNGLCILGICAGKYNLYDHIVYRGSNGQLKEQSGLGFIKGTSIGPVDRDFAPEQPTQSRFDGTRMIKVAYNTLSGQTIQTGVCYGDGPAGMIEQSDDVEVIGRYSELDGQPVAIVCKKMGKGLIIATGVLPEIALSHMIVDEKQAHLYPVITALRQAMAPYENGRKTIMDDIVARFSTHRNLASRAQPMLSVPS